MSAEIVKRKKSELSLKNPAELKDLSLWNARMSFSPPKKWLKIHPIAKSLYLPIDKVELLLMRYYPKHRIEIIKTEIMFHSIAVSVRVHYCHPITGEWSFFDGVGAAPVQTDSGKSASELQYIKSNAITLALPIAKSFAIKDACHHFGRLFGKDLNRKDIEEFTSAYADYEEDVVDVKIEANE